jgi:Tfp pilus assembly PilM family ATPase
VAVVDAGARLTFMALFNKGVLVLVRKFDLGTETIVTKVQQQLNVDRDTARGIISDGSFDISQSVRAVMDPFLRQLTISKDFVERREDCRVVKCYLSGGASLLRYGVDEIRGATGVDTGLWNPFANLQIADGAYPAELAGHEPRFAAAVGACLGVLEE